MKQLFLIFLLIFCVAISATEQITYDKLKDNVNKEVVYEGKIVKLENNIIDSSTFYCKLENNVYVLVKKEKDRILKNDKLYVVIEYFDNKKERKAKKYQPEEFYVVDKQKKFTGVVKVKPGTKYYMIDTTKK